MTRGDAAELIYEVQEVREANDGTVSGSVSIAPPGDAIDSGDATTNALLNNPKFSILLNVWKRANTDFYYQKDVNQDELVYGAVQGMVGKLKDPYTIFEEPSDAADLQQYLQGQFEGIGTVMNLVNGKIVVVKTLAGSPAEKAGIKIGDVIEKINGQDISKLTEAQVLDEIRGNAGTTVHLTLLRNNSEIDVDVTRAKITISSVNGTVINGIADISIDEFTENSANDFTGTLENVNKQSPKGYIIDLRGNPGGYLESAVQMLGHFIETGKTVVSTKDNQGNVHAIQTTGAAELKGKPIVILVDGETASAAEIMAGALQDYKIGKLVGVKTFGKGSVQEISNYSDDSLLKITVAHWLTPNGRDINGVGLTPDINAELDQTQLLQGKDSQLQKAIDTINSMSPTS